MNSIIDHISDYVDRASNDPALLENLSDQLVPVMMHLSLENVQLYKEKLAPLVHSVEEGSPAYTYLLIIIGFSSYRTSKFSEVVDSLISYEVEFEDALTNVMSVCINALIGASYRSLGQTEFALEYFQRNIPYNQIERNDHEYFYSLTLYHIAELYGELNEYEAMLDRHRLNLEFFEHVENTDFYFRSLNGVGRAYRGLNEYDKALTYLLEAKEKSKKNGNIPFQARSLHDLGSLYAKINRIEASLEYFGKALDLRKEHKLINASISTTMEMARILIDDDRLNEAIQLLKQALKEAEHLAVKKKAFNICKLLSEAYEKNQQLSEALQYYKKFYEIKESVDNVYYTQAENQRIREINTILEEQKKLIEEQSLKIEDSNVAIQALNENLEAIVHERTRQLHERHEQLKRYAFMNAHEVRGPLSTILGLLQIADTFATIEEKEELIQMIEESSLKLDQTVRAMHQDLVQFNET